MLHHCVAKRGARREIKQREAADEQQRPQQQEQQKRERAINAVDLLAHLLVGGALGHHHPGPPGGDEEDTCELKATGRATRQNDGLKRVKRHPQGAEQSANKCRDVHEKSFILSK